MLEKAADDADHSYPVADAFHTGAQTTNTAHDEIDFHTCLRRLVKRLDRVAVHERVHLRNDSTALPFTRVLRLAVDQLAEPQSHVSRRDQELAIKPLP